MNGPVIVSACLVGIRCNQRGEANETPELLALASRESLVPVCPETMGGLPTPRAAAEIVGERVVNADGRDVTEAFERGAMATLALARAVGASEAVLKSRSPSCGCGEIRDGTFSGRLVRGDGVTARLLCEHGIRVRSEEDIVTQEETSPRPN